MHAGGQGFESLILHHFYAQNQGITLPVAKSGNVKYDVIHESHRKIKYADVVELADTPDLGSGAAGVQVRVLSSAPYKNRWDTPSVFVLVWFVELQDSNLKRRAC